MGPPGSEDYAGSLERLSVFILFYEWLSQKYLAGLFMYVAPACKEGGCPRIITPDERPL